MNNYNGESTMDDERISANTLTWQDKKQTNCCHFDGFASMEFRNCLGCRCASLFAFTGLKRKKI